MSREQTDPRLAGSDRGEMLATLMRVRGKVDRQRRLTRPTWAIGGARAYKCETLLRVTARQAYFSRVQLRLF